MRTAPVGEERRIDELGSVRHAGHAPGRVDEGDEAVRLAAAELGVEPEDGGRLAAGPAQATADVGQQVPQATRREGVLEELGGVAVLGGGGPADDLGEVSGEIALGDRALQDVRTGRTEGEDGRRGHFRQGSNSTTGRPHGNVW